MKTAQIAVLGIAAVAGAAALYLASGSDPKPAPVATPVPQMETTEVLVARSDIPLGQTITADDMQWQSWPAAGASSSFIKRNDRGDAPTQLIGSIVRSPFFAGEPIRETKLVKGNGSGFMAAILPNDKVDVILTKREKNIDKSGAADVINAEIILSNIRVLAIDQTVEEKNGQKVVVGKTATLELKPEQAEQLARSRQTGTLSLALRSLVDANKVEAKIDDGNAKRDTINIVRYGVSTTTTTQK